jgi:hypothetical protein
MRQPLLALAFLFATLPAAAQIRVQYAPRSLQITGASPLGDVAVFGVNHSYQRGREMVTSHQSVEHMDATGALTLSLSDLSFQSVWLLVDVNSGDYALFSPPGYQPRRVAVPPGSVDRLGHSALHIRPTAEMFVVRQRAGAWHVHAQEGTSAGLNDARLTVDAERLKPVGAAQAAPQQLRAGDIVMMFDAPSMEFWLTKLTAADLPGEQ